MQYGYFCEDCEVSVWPSTTRSELKWLRDRTHIVTEVSKHTATGLDTWIVEGLDFLDTHHGHSVMLVSKK
ncbi:MAG TPA: hypothetical protein VIG32_03995 [Candidatus Baltobacteraceae bacterium]|jgi:hypothetical protein